MINQPVLKSAYIETKLGTMIAIADNEALCLLEFVDGKGVENEVKRLKATITPGENDIIKNITEEMTRYFAGDSMVFKTPMHVTGSPFQKMVWEQLCKIPAGETRSYLQVAKSIHAPKACRAVARANASNQLAIIIPCHRVINANNAIGGYGGGVPRKQWLLDHEKKFAILHRVPEPAYSCE